MKRRLRALSPLLTHTTPLHDPSSSEREEHDEERQQREQRQREDRRKEWERTNERDPSMERHEVHVKRSSAGGNISFSLKM